MTYTYRCLECGNKFDWHNVSMENRDIFKPQCTRCHAKTTKRIIADRMFFTFAEGMGDISNKPDSYWANAERNRLKHLARRDAEKREKEFYSK